MVFTVLVCYDEKKKTISSFNFQSQISISKISNTISYLRYPPHVYEISEQTFKFLFRNFFTAVQTQTICFDFFFKKLKITVNSELRVEMTENWVLEVFGKRFLVKCIGKFLTNPDEQEC